MANKKRKGVKTKTEPETPVNLETTVPQDPPELDFGGLKGVVVDPTGVDYAAVQEASDVDIPQAEESVETNVSELTISVTPKIYAFLQRITANASSDNPYTVEEAVLDILTEWVNIYENEDDGGIERAIVAEDSIEEDYPEFAEAFEERARS